MGRLIDADALIEEINKKMPQGSARGVFKAFIDEQPTAYNVENVVAEIRRCSGNGYRDVDGDYVPPMIRTKDVIDIVKRGDVDERA